jgi:hypothetical protein
MAGDGMNSTTIRAFRDELTKIALLGYIGNAIRTGWEGPPEGSPLLEKDPELKQTWFGHGRSKKYDQMTKLEKGIENVTTLGGLTGPDPTGKRKFLKKGLPVGTKSMMALTTASMLPGAIQKEDPSGQGRSRAERMAGLVGSTAGGLFGVGALLRSGKVGPMGSNFIGGIGGSMLGEKIFTAPWRHRRQRQQMMAAQQQQMQPQQVPQPMAPQGEVVQ